MNTTWLNQVNQLFKAQLFLTGYVTNPRVLQGSAESEAGSDKGVPVKTKTALRTAREPLVWDDACASC